MDLEVMKSAEDVGLKIGNPVPYNEGKLLLIGCNSQLDIAFWIQSATLWLSSLSKTMTGASGRIYAAGYSGFC